MARGTQVNPPSVLNSVKIAKEKSLAVQVGLQRHHERKYMATVKAMDIV